MYCMCVCWKAERDVARAEVERERDEKQKSEELCRQLQQQVAHLEETVRELESRSADPDDEVRCIIISRAAEIDD